MKHIALKTSLLCFSATLLLFVGTIPAKAQYYMNVFQKNGTKVQYLISDLDSVTYTAGSNPIIPVIKKNVSKLSISYVENYTSIAKIESDVITFSYDNQNRVSNLSSKDRSIKLDYSKNGSILIKSEDNDTMVVFQLDNSGYVNSLIANGRSATKVVFEYDGDYVSKMTSGPLSGEPEPNHYYMSYGFEHENGVLTHLSMNDNGADIPYRYNYMNPAINIDVDWLIFTGGEIEYAPMWLGYCGKINDKLFELGVFSYMTSRVVDVVSKPSPGTYHYEQKYYKLDLANGSMLKGNNVTIESDSDGAPITITYSIDVAEYLWSYDYTVDSYGISHKIKETEKDEPTGVIVGTNDIVYKFEYK